MAREGLFFRRCAALHPQTGTPGTALVYQGVWSMVLTLTGSYSDLLTYTMFASVLFGGLTVAAVFTAAFQRSPTGRAPIAAGATRSRRPCTW